MSPDFLEESFYWSFDVNRIVFKENLSAKFEYLYDARGKNPDVNEDNKRFPLSFNNDSKVLVEYTLII